VLLLMVARFSVGEVRAVRKERDAWWTVLLADPIAVRCTYALANWTRVTPNQLTLASLAVGLGAAACFAVATPYALVVGALVYHAGFVLDCCDGKIARLKGTGSPFGGWLDYVCDRIRVLCCAVALSAGLYERTGRSAYFYLGFLIIFLDMFRYLNALQMSKTRQEMGIVGSLVPSQDGRRQVSEGISARGRLSGLLRRHRIRTHLVSGIEFQMAAFVVGPLTGCVVVVPVVAGVLMVMFEAVYIHRLWKKGRVGCPATAAEAATAAGAGSGTASEAACGSASEAAFEAVVAGRR
jgi:phosphatidylglycerophosphate synthase